MASTKAEEELLSAKALLSEMMARLFDNMEENR